MSSVASLEPAKKVSKAKARRKNRDPEDEEGTILTVSYGPRSEVLGTIKVSESASYANVRKLIHPLVAIYYERLKKSGDDMISGDAPFQDTAGDRTDAFRMVDPYDVVVDRESEGVSSNARLCIMNLTHFKHYHSLSVKSRIVLSELYGSDFPTNIVVRPITWLKLPKCADEDD